MDAIIQNRRGDYSEVIPENLRPGEYVVIQQNDPNSDSGQSVYVGIKSGVVKRLAFSDEVGDYHIQAQQAVQQAQQAQAQTAIIAGQVNTKAEQVSTNAQAAASSATAAQTAAQTATTEAGEAAQSKTDAQTASQTAVEVLDSMARKYSDSKTYVVGDLVIHDNQLYECKTAITTAETWNSSHWTASTVENQITDLKGTLDEAVDELKEDLMGLQVEFPDVSLWESGGISVYDGTDGTNAKRIRTGFISRSIKSVIPANGYKTGIYAYSSSGTYIGMYDGTNYSQNTLHWNISAVNLLKIPSEYKIRIVGSKDSDANITTSDAVYFLFGVNTDTSLTQSGKAADAKVVGDGLNNVEVNINILNDSGLIPLDGHPLIQGSYNGRGEVVVKDSSIRTSGYIPVHKGEKITFTAGTKAAQILIGVFDTAKVWQREIAWQNDGAVIDVDADGYYIILFRTSSAKPPITPSDYDAITQIVPLWKSEIEETAEELEEEIGNIEPGLSDEAKEALLTCFSHVAWTDPHGQDYYDALYTALYGSEPPAEIWDYEWTYTDGLPTDNGLAMYYNGTYTVEMTSDGLHVASENATDKNVRFVYESFLDNSAYASAVYELEFLINSFGSYAVAPYGNGVRLYASLGKGIDSSVHCAELVLNSSGTQYLADGASWTLLDDTPFVINTLYKVRIEQSTSMATIYVNNTLIGTITNAKEKISNPAFYTYRGQDVLFKSFRFRVNE